MKDEKAPARVEQEDNARTRPCQNNAVDKPAGSKGGLSPWQILRTESLVADRSRRNPLPTGAPHGGEFQNAPGERFERGACPAREGRPGRGCAVRENGGKPPLNCVMCRGSLAIRWHAERFSKRKSPHKALLASCLSHLTSNTELFRRLCIFLALMGIIAFGRSRARAENIS